MIMSLRPDDLGTVLIRLTLEPNAAKHVTSVKISPSKNFLLLGSSSVGDDKYTSFHPVVRIFKIDWATKAIVAVFEDRFVLPSQPPPPPQPPQPPQPQPQPQPPPPPPNHTPPPPPPPPVTATTQAATPPPYVHQNRGDDKRE